MNWYKIAFPVMDRSSVNYLDIGHDYDKQNQILWFIDEDWSIHLKEVGAADGYSDTHSAWAFYQNSQDVHAKGRYDKDSHTASVSITGMRGTSSYQKEWKKKQIEKILDKEFNNPTIVVY